MCPVKEEYHSEEFKTFPKKKVDKQIKSKLKAAKKGDKYEAGSSPGKNYSAYAKPAKARAQAHVMKAVSNYRTGVKDKKKAKEVASNPKTKSQISDRNSMFKGASRASHHYHDQSKDAIKKTGAAVASGIVTGKHRISI